MARVTVEDCIQVVNNRFELVLLAAQRARDISAGQQLEVDRDNDKNPVVALREVADKLLDLDDLRALLRMPVYHPTDEEVLRRGLRRALKATTVDATELDAIRCADAPVDCDAVDD